MPKRPRRFEPWCGVSRPMVEAEAKAVGRELESHLLLSIQELRERLAETGKAWNQADEPLHAAVFRLPERERLAIQRLIVRDMYLILELYLECTRSLPALAEAAVPPQSQRVEESAPSLPFSQWLFAE